MSSRWPTVDSIQQVRELNRLFLDYLSCCVGESRDCLDLPSGAQAVWHSGGRLSLDAVAEFPRALFKIDLDDPSTVRDVLSSREAGMRHSLHVSILLCAWTFSRQSAYQARLLLGLESRAIARLRMMQLGDLPRLAHGSRLVRCAFAAREWLWMQLLTETRPEARHRLVLIALQPSLEHESPARKAALQFT